MAGSVAHKLVSKIHTVPIAVVGGNPEPQKILIGFDGSEGSMKGVDFVCSILPGKERVITLCLLVIEPSFPEAESRLIDAGLSETATRSRTRGERGSLAGPFSPC